MRLVYQRLQGNWRRIPDKQSLVLQIQVRNDVGLFRMTKCVELIGKICLNPIIYMKTDWNLGLLFKNEKEIAKERKVVEEKTNAFVKKWEGRDDYLKDAKILKLALDEYNEWSSKWGAGEKEIFYYHLKESL